MRLVVKDDDRNLPRSSYTFVDLTDMAIALILISN